MHVLLFALLVGGNTILWSVDDVLYTRLGNDKPPAFSLQLHEGLTTHPVQ